MLQKEGVINRVTTIKCNWDHHINHSMKQPKLRVFHLVFRLFQRCIKLQTLSLALGMGSKAPLNFLYHRPIHGELT